MDKQRRDSQAFQSEDRVELRNYGYQHGLADSSLEDNTMIGRTALMERFLGWLKLNHREPGTGLRHGCYLITGTRGAGKTTFVNRVLHQYRKWLLWLHGDEHRQIHEVRLNLGAGKLTPQTVLQFIAEGLHNQARSPYLEPIFTSLILWIMALAAILLGTDLLTRAGQRMVDWKRERAAVEVSRDIALDLIPPEGVSFELKSAGPGRCDYRGHTETVRGKLLVPKAGASASIRRGARTQANPSSAHRGTAVFDTLSVSLDLFCDELGGIKKYTSPFSQPARVPGYLGGLSSNGFHTGWGMALKSALFISAWSNSWAYNGGASANQDILRAERPFLWGCLGPFTGEKILRARHVQAGRDMTWIDLMTVFPILAMVVASVIYMARRVQRPLIRKTQGRFADYVVRFIAVSIATPLLANILCAIRADPYAQVSLPLVPSLFNLAAVAWRHGSRRRVSDDASLQVPTYLLTEGAFAAAGVLLALYCTGLFTFAASLEKAACVALVVAVLAAASLGAFCNYWRIPAPVRRRIVSDSDPRYVARFFLHAALIVGVAGLLLSRAVQTTYLVLGALVLLFVLSVLNQHAVHVPRLRGLAGRVFPDFRQRGTANFEYCHGYLKTIILLSLCAVCAAVASAVSTGSHMTTLMNVGIGAMLDVAGWFEKMLPLVVALAYSDAYVAGHAMTEPDFGNPNAERRSTAGDDSARRNVLERAGCSHSAIWAISTLYNHLQFQRKLRAIHRRLRSNRDRHVGSGTALPFVPALSLRWTDLPYTYQTLESDLIQAILLHNRAYPHRDVVIIFDELDKITLEAEDGEDKRELDFPTLRPKEIDAVHALLSDMKNLISSAEARFIFIAGREVRDHWLMDMSEKVNLVSSAFAGTLDVPSLLTDQVEEHDRRLESMTAALVGRRIMDLDEQEDAWRHFIDTRALTPRQKELGLAVGCPRGIIDGTAVDRRPVPSSCFSELVVAVKTTAAALGCVLTPQGRATRDAWEGVQAHYLQFPSHFSIAHALALRCAETRRGKHVEPLANVIRRALHVRDLILYLTFRGAGLPSAMNVHFDRCVEEGAHHRKLDLVFDARLAPALQLASYFMTVLGPALSGAAEQYGDKAVLTAVYFASYLCRFSWTAFDWAMAEEMRDVVSPYHDPNVRNMLRVVFNRYEEACLVPIHNGVYSHRFAEWLRSEISYVASRASSEAASYSFGFEQGEEVRGHVLDQIESLKKHHDKGGDGKGDSATTRGLHSLYCVLGELYEIEEMYHLALDAYKLALREVKQISNIQMGPKAAPTGSFGASDYSWMLMHVRIRLRIGHVYELIGDAERALSYYGEAVSFSAWTFDRIVREVEKDGLAALVTCVPRFVASRLLGQPFMCVASAMMKVESSSGGSDRFRAVVGYIDQLDKLEGCLAETLDDLPRTASGDAVSRSDDDRYSLQNILDEIRSMRADAYSRVADNYLMAGGGEAERASRYYGFAMNALASVSDQAKKSAAVRLAFAHARSSLGDAHLSRPAALDCLQDLVGLRVTRPVGQPCINHAVRYWGRAACLYQGAGNWRAAAFQWAKMLGGAQRGLVALNDLGSAPAGELVARWRKARRSVARILKRSVIESVAMARRQDELLMGVVTSARGMKASEAHSPFLTKAVEQREAELRYLYCCSTAMWKASFPEWWQAEDGPVLERWRSLAAKVGARAKAHVDRLEGFYRYSYFPIRLKALYMEIRGDVDVVSARERCARYTWPKKSPAGTEKDHAEAKRAETERAEIAHELLTAYRFYLWALDIRGSFGPSFNATHFAVALLRDKAAHVLRLFEAVMAGEDGASDKERVTRILAYAARGTDFPMTEDLVREADSTVQFELARAAYRKSIEARTMGPEFRRLMREYSYLMDDFHGDQTHYPVAYESMMVPFSESRLARTWPGREVLFPGLT